MNSIFGFSPHGSKIGQLGFNIKEQIGVALGWLSSFGATTIHLHFHEKIFQSLNTFLKSFKNILLVMTSKHQNMTIIKQGCIHRGDCCDPGRT